MMMVLVLVVVIWTGRGCWDGIRVDFDGGEVRCCRVRPVSGGGCCLAASTRDSAAPDMELEPLPWRGEGIGFLGGGAAGLASASTWCCSCWVGWRASVLWSIERGDDFVVCGTEFFRLSCLGHAFF